jgi:hypothetical protein
MRQSLLVAVAIPALIGGGAARAEQKPSAESIVARHLEALGPPDAQAAARALRVVQGTSHFEIRRGGAGSLDGKARVSSEGRRFRLELGFSSSEYYGETLAYDGHKVEVGFMQTGRRSPLGEFLATYDVLLKEGLVAGVLSSAWPFLDLPGRGPKLKYEGLKKVGDRTLHEIAYKAARGQGDVHVSLFFEPESFRHVRSEYRIALMPSMSSAIDHSASQQDTRFELDETFADFETLGGLTLPKRWTLTFTMDGPSTNALWRWENVIAKVSTAGEAPPAP